MPDIRVLSLDKIGLLSNYNKSVGKKVVNCPRPFIAVQSDLYR
ncbi:hypothetical protein M137_2807 [Bacteroides fragilis str. S36L12]|nr:hypothetical protein M078_2293 [Bacteroides fragilis str. 2-F-2 \